MQAFEVIGRQARPAPDVTGLHGQRHRRREPGTSCRLAQVHAATFLVRIEARRGVELPGFVMAMTHAMAAPGGGRRGRTEELS